MKTTQARAGCRADLAEYYRGLLEEQARSGLSVTEFAAGTGMSAATLYSWRRRLADAGDPGEGGDLLEVRITDEETSGRGGSPIVLTVDGRLRVELESDFDAGALERLLRLLRC